MVKNKKNSLQTKTEVVDFKRFPLQRRGTQIDFLVELDFEL